MPTTKAVSAVVTISEPRGGGTVDSEVTVRSLEELFEACRRAQAAHVVRVSLIGPDGEVSLNFASFIRK
jgi:hypothetical protein